MQAQLRPGTVLDGRYRIDAMLGQGGFGITYAAENLRIGLKVAVKELFWRGHSARRDESSPEVALDDAADAPVFEAQKRRFLQEARTLRDFSGQSGIVSILDYFEANGTAYIVMEYVEGETLAARSAAGPMPCDDLLRRFLPLIDTLDAVHRAGIIHRDISPDNIMVQPDGSLKLIDFGAARQYRGEGGSYTAISRDSYSPGEQYDKNGRQGPWTDVYSLCATLYACICGAPPQGAVQRMFLDELAAPSALGVNIRPACEAILMKGLQLRPEKRYQDMGELAKAIRAALPEETPPRSSHKGLLIGLLAGLLCAGAVLGLLAWRRYDAAHRFRGIETERIRISATDDTTAAEFADAQAELRSRLEAFAGKDNYILNANAADMEVTLPLSLFEGQEIISVIREHFSQLVPGKGTNILYEYKADWENPDTSKGAGKNQVPPSALEGPSIVYAFSWRGTLTAGQRDNLIVDVKARLDALGTPYAFGTAYGNPDVLMFRIGTGRAGLLVENTLISSSPLQIGCDIASSFGALDHNHDRLERLEGDDGICLRLEMGDDDRIQRFEDYTRAMLESGLDTVCLMDPWDNVIAHTHIDSAVEDGVLEFREFCFEGISELDADNLWLTDYLRALLSETDLPTFLCQYEGYNCIDSDGNVHLDDAAPEYGLRYVRPSVDTGDLGERLEALQRDHGYTVREDSDRFWLSLHLTPDEQLAERAETLLPGILEALAIDHEVLPKSLIIRMIDEDDDRGLRLCINSDYYFAEKRFRTDCQWVWLGTDLEACYNALMEWSQTFDWDAVGLEMWSR